MAKKMKNEVLTDADVLRYIDLAARKSYIIVNSGIGWKPEYAEELVQINRELMELRLLIDAEHARRAG